MKTWDSKLVWFLSDSNTIAIKNENEFIQFKALMKKVGLNFKYKNYGELYHLAFSNDFLLSNNTILIEYNNSKGFCIGWKSVESSIDWYGMEPFTFSEIIEELGEN